MIRLTALIAMLTLAACSYDLPFAETSGANEVGRAELQEALNTSCSANTALADAMCRPTDEGSEFICDYTLKDEGGANVRRTIIALNGNSWKLIDIPNHCLPQ